MANERFITPVEGTQILIQTANFSQGLLPLQFRLVRAMTYTDPALRVDNSDLSQIYKDTLRAAREIVFAGRGEADEASSRFHPLHYQGEPITDNHVETNVQKQVEYMRLLLKSRLNPAEIDQAGLERMTGGITLEQIIFTSQADTLKAIAEGMQEREQHFRGRRGGREFFRPYILEGKPTKLALLDRVFADVKAQLSNAT